MVILKPKIYIFTLINSGSDLFIFLEKYKQQSEHVLTTASTSVVLNPLRV